jgi:putative ribosome biogenesis GTPase RsgA
MTASAARKKNETSQFVDVAAEDVACGKGPCHHVAEKACHLAISLEQHFIKKSRKKYNRAT